MFYFTFRGLLDLNYPLPLISCSLFKSKEAYSLAYSVLDSLMIQEVVQVVKSGYSITF